MLEPITCPACQGSGHTLTDDQAPCSLCRGNATLPPSALEDAHWVLTAIADQMADQTKYQAHCAELRSAAASLKGFAEARPSGHWLHTPALQARVAELEQALRDSQDWNWLTAKEEAGDAGRDTFEITEMQALADLADNPQSRAFVLRAKFDAAVELRWKLDSRTDTIAIGKCQDHIQALREELEALEGPDRREDAP